MTDPSTAAMLDAIASAIGRAARIVFFTGAGISAESGLPTYRGVGGLYNEITIDEGLPIEDILSGETFARAPGLTWKYLLEIERACRGAAPNAAHVAIAELERLCEVCVITQNVDGFHSAAGSTNVIELHGRLRELVCTSCGRREEAATFDEFALPPRCVDCRGIIRPNVVFFGEMLPVAAVARYDRELTRGFDLYFAVGTTAGFPYISAPIREAGRRGALSVEINPDRTVLSSVVDYRVSSGAVAALRGLHTRIARNA